MVPRASESEGAIVWALSGFGESEEATNDLAEATEVDEPEELPRYFVGEVSVGLSDVETVGLFPIGRVSEFSGIVIEL